MKPPRKPAPTAEQSVTQIGPMSALDTFKLDLTTALGATAVKPARMMTMNSEKIMTRKLGGTDQDLLQEALRTRMMREISSHGRKPILSTAQSTALDPVTSINLKDLIDRVEALHQGGVPFLRVNKGTNLMERLGLDYATTEPLYSFDRLQGLDIRTDARIPVDVLVMMLGDEVQKVIPLTKEAKPAARLLAYVMLGKGS